MRDDSARRLTRGEKIGLAVLVLIPTVMNAITLTAVLSAILGPGPDDPRKGLILYYATASGIVFAAIAARNLSNKRIDADFEEQFEICAAERSNT